jgi:hypothetical protein
MRKGIIAISLLVLFLVNCQLYSGFSDAPINQWYFNNGDGFYRYHDAQRFYNGSSSSYNLSVRLKDKMKNVKIWIYRGDTMNMLNYFSVSNVNQINMTITDLPMEYELVARIQVLETRNFEHTGVGTWSFKNSLF